MVVLFLWLILLFTFIPINVKIKALIKVTECLVLVNTEIGVLNFPFEIAMNEDGNWILSNRKSKRKLRLKNGQNKRTNAIAIRDFLDAFYMRKLSLIGAIGIENNPALVKGVKNSFIIFFKLIENTILKNFNEKALFLHDLTNSSNCEIQVDTELETSFFRIIFVFFKIILGGKYGQVRNKKFNTKSVR